MTLSIVGAAACRRVVCCLSGSGTKHYAVWINRAPRTHCWLCLAALFQWCLSCTVAHCLKSVTAREDCSWPILVQCSQFTLKDYADPHHLMSLSSKSATGFNFSESYREYLADLYRSERNLSSSSIAPRMLWKVLLILMKIWKKAAQVL